MFDAPREVIFVTITAATAKYGRFPASQVHALWDTVSGEPCRGYRGVQLILKRRPHVESVCVLRHPFGSDDDQQIGALEEFTEGELSNWLLVNAGDPETIDCEEIPSKIILRRILYNSESCDEIILSSTDPVFAGIEIKISEGATA